MWGTWFIGIFGAVAVILFLVAIAFGTAIVPFGLAIAGVIALVALFAGAIWRRAAETEPPPGERSGRRASGAPAAGEGSTPPSSA